MADILRVSISNELLDRTPMMTYFQSELTNVTIQIKMK